MRIDTSGRKEYRKDLYDRAGGVVGEKTRVGAIDVSCRFAIQMIGDRSKKGKLQEALEHEDMTPELASILSTQWADLEFTIEETRELHTRDQ